MTNDNPTKLIYGYPESVHNLAQHYIDREILKCDNLLVGRLLEHCAEGWLFFADDFDYDRIENYYDTSIVAIEEFLISKAQDDTWQNLPFDQKEAFAEDLGFEPLPRDILEWWAVTEWLADKLIEFDEPVLRNCFGYWWGRTCSGQAIILDGILQQIAEATL